MIIPAEAPPPYRPYQARATSSRLARLPDPLLQRIVRQVSFSDLLFSLRRADKLCYESSMEWLREAFHESWMQELFARGSARQGSDSSGVYTMIGGTYPAAPSSAPAGIRINRENTRELAVLDLYISACVVKFQLSQLSDLYLLADDDLAKDIFEYMRPKARLEDLTIARLYRSPIATPTPASGEKGHLVVQPSIDPRDIGVTLSRSRLKISVQLPFRSASGGSSIVRKSVVDVELAARCRLEQIAQVLVEDIEALSLRKRGDVYERF